MEKAVFLDRDGTIIEDTGYPCEIVKIKFLPGVGEAINLVNRSGFRVIVVANQSGVARGYFTEETVEKVNNYIQESLAKQGAFIDKFYYCPHHIEGDIEKYAKECYCRKPNPGMIEEATRDFGIDTKDSFLIGDKMSDIEAGRRAGCRTILLRDKRLTDAGGETFPSDHIAADLYEAAEWLTRPSCPEEKRL